MEGGRCGSFSWLLFSRARGPRGDRDGVVFAERFLSSSASVPAKLPRPRFPVQPRAITKAFCAADFASFCSASFSLRRGQNGKGTHCSPNLRVLLPLSRGAFYALRVGQSVKQRRNALIKSAFASKTGLI